MRRGCFCLILVVLLVPAGVFVSSGTETDSIDGTGQWGWVIAEQCDHQWEKVYWEDSIYVESNVPHMVGRFEPYPRWRLFYIHTMEEPHLVIGVMRCSLCGKRKLSIEETE